MKVSIAKARAELSKILQLVEKGEEVVITDHNEPKFQIIPIYGKFSLPSESAYSKFLEQFQPVSLKRGAKSSLDLIREERDRE